MIYTLILVSNLNFLSNVGQWRGGGRAEDNGKDINFLLFK